MNLAAILEIIKGVIAFPDAILKVVRLLRGLPSDKHDALLNSMQKEAEKFTSTGRPTW